MTTPEGKIEEYLVDRVRATGGKIRKLKWIGRNGAPDRMVWWPPKGEWPTYTKFTLVFVELKARNKKLSKTQVEEIRKMRKDGFTVYVADRTEIIDDIIFHNAPLK